MRLQEARTIKSGADAVALLNSGKLAGRLGGKKFIPTWIVEDPESFSELVDLTIKLIGPDANLAGDETIQFLIKSSVKDSEKWIQILEKTPDTVRELSRAFNAQWFTKSPEWQELLKSLAEAEEFDEHDWRELEKSIQETFAERAAKKGKKISNTDALYDTLYDDGVWKLFVPKSFEGDIELAKHIVPFIYEGSEYTKTRWCTAAGENYFNTYTNKGRTRLYVVQYWNKEGYKEAWQVAFYRESHVEFMDKTDHPKYQTLLNRAPEGLLRKVVCDNKDCNLVGQNLFDLWRIAQKYRKDYRVSVDEVFKLPIGILQKELHCFRRLSADILASADGKVLTAIKRPAVSRVLEIPNGVEATTGDALKGLSTYETVVLPPSFRSFGRELKGVKKVIFAEGSKIVNEGLLHGATDLRIVELPSTLKAIGPRAFSGCYRLESITIPEGVAQICDESFEGTRLHVAILPNSLATLGERAFAHCEDLVSVKVGSKVRIIPESCFYMCDNLETVELSTNLNFIGKSAFEACPRLTNVDFYDNFKDPYTDIQYGPRAFNECPYQEVLQAAGVYTD